MRDAARFWDRETVSASRRPIGRGRRRRSRPASRGSAWATLTIAGLLMAIGLVGASLVALGEEPRVIVVDEAVSNPPPASIAPAGMRSWADIVEQVYPAVVVVETDSSAGSGFFVDESGVIATNFHVVEGCIVGESIRVKVFRRAGPGHPASVGYEDCVAIYLDPLVDLALLEVVGADAPFEAIELEPADAYRTGDDVAAIGSPGAGQEQLENTFSRGVISCRQRRGSDGLDHVQIDVAVNPGNSGGPVLDRRGRAIGMTTWGFSGLDGLNFAVPVATIRDALDRVAILSDGTARTAEGRAALDGFWDALLAGDAAVVRRHLPIEVHARFLSDLRPLLLEMKVLIEVCRSIGLSDERIVDELITGQPEVDALLPHLLDGWNPEEGSSDEMVDILADMQVEAARQLEGGETLSLVPRGAVLEFLFVAGAGGLEERSIRGHAVRLVGGWRVLLDLESMR